MSTPLIAVPAGPASQAGSVITAGDWFPEIDCNRFRDEFRLGDVVTHDRLQGALRGAMVTVLGELTDWTAQAILDGHANLAAVRPDPEIDGEAAIVHAFRRAVQFHAAAELAELHRDLSATAEGSARADTQLLSAADYRRLATHAVRDVKGVTRTSVELI
jgi:hypothetical protein